MGFRLAPRIRLILTRIHILGTHTPTHAARTPIRIVILTAMDHTLILTSDITAAIGAAVGVVDTTDAATATDMAAAMDTAAATDMEVAVSSVPAATLAMEAGGAMQVMAEDVATVVMAAAVRVDSRAAVDLGAVTVADLAAATVVAAAMVVVDGGSLEIHTR